MIVKPNASMFYFKSSVENELVDADKGFAYRYQVKPNFLVSSYDLSLLHENDLLLTRVGSARDVRAVSGRFVFRESDEKNLILFFSPIDDSDPRTNQKEYVIYNHIILFSRPMGLFYLILWILGVILFSIILFKSPKKRKLLSEFQIFKLTPFNPNQWKNLLLSTITAAFAFVFIEWLFFVTKPSFMEILNWWEKFRIFLLTGFLLSIVGIIALLLFASIDYLFSTRKIATILPILGLIFPSLILSLLALMMVDNFTNTIFSWGVINTEGIWRGVYGLILIAVSIEIMIKLYETLDFQAINETKPISNNLSKIIGGLFLLSMIIFFFQPKFFRNNSSFEEEDANKKYTSSYPNIILLGSDGLNARNLSVYGYERDTTPRIKDLARTSRLAENAFPNAGNSSGSVISILTGKLPTKTRLFYPPDILKGNDAYQHLPGILRREGYKNIEIAVPYYVDSFTMNMQNGFDIVNGRSAIDNNLLNEVGDYDVAYFVSTLIEWVEARILHLFYVKKMVDPYQIVTQPSQNQAWEDKERIDQLLDIVLNSEEPVFVHVHLMGTHGPKFNPSHRVFSKGMEQDDAWMTDFYDDAILEFDTYVGKVIDTLSNAGEIDNTILIIYTDHAQKYQVNVRVPLLIHFPRNEYQGRIQKNVQNLDISSTILDYLDLSQPDWMEGDSLLKTDVPNQRLILSTQINNKLIENEGNWSLEVDRLTPPFYQLGYIYAIDCQNWHVLDLQLMNWRSGEINGYTHPCNDYELLSKDQIKDEVVEHLTSDGYDTSSIP